MSDLGFMQIYIAKDNERLGPYSLKEVQYLLETGELSGEELAWHEELDDWKALGDLLPAPKERATFGDFKYKAFISYSHQDKKWGDWLHKALETYRIPKGLIGKKTLYGEVPKRLFPVFRDREELPTAFELGEVINKALEQSSHLIVICSPRSAQSQWVNEEVKEFKRLGKADRILCLIVDGEPNAADKPNMGEEECFPETVKYELGSDGQLSTERTEPIAADAREGKDEKANALLKLLAGLLGVGFDELKQRDAVRRQKRMALVAGVSVVLMAVMGALAIWAMTQRSEAVKQRGVAETKQKEAEEAKGAEVKQREKTEEQRQEAVKQKGIAETKQKEAEAAKEEAVKQKGIAEAKQNEAEKAREGEAKERKKALTELKKAEEVSDWAAGIFKGVKQGELDNATKEQKFLLEKTLERSAARIRDLKDKPKVEAKIRLILGEAYHDINEDKKALEHHERALALYLKSPDPNDEGEVVRCYINIGAVRNKMAEYDKALEHFQKALAIQLKQLGPNHPHVAITYTNIGEVYRAKGESAKALEYQKKALAIGPNQNGPENPVLVASKYNNLAAAHFNKGESTKALELWGKALAIFLKHLGPNHPNVAICYNNIGHVYHEMDELDAALKHFHKALEINLKQLGPEHTAVALGYRKIGVMHFNREEYDQALEYQEKALTIRLKRRGPNHPDTVESRADVDLSKRMIKSNQKPVPKKD